MKAIIDERLADRKRSVEQRLDKNRLPADRSRPMLQSPNLQFELAGRGVGTSYGGVALVQQLARRLGLAQAIDERLHLFKVHLPYHESDHVLSLAYNALRRPRARGPRAAAPRRGLSRPVLCKALPHNEAGNAQSLKS